MRWRLRRARPGDAPALSLVAGASFLETFAGVLPGPDIVAHVAVKSSPAQFVGWATASDSVVTIAEHPDGGALVGYTVLTTPEEVGETGPHDIEVRRIYTMALTRGTGLGAGLMAQVIADARGLGATRLLLGVFAGNRVARAFYERQGFAAIQARRFKIGESWHDDMVYARPI